MEKSELPNPDELSKIRQEYKAPVVITPVDDKTIVTPKEEKTSTQSKEAPKAEVTVVEETKPITIDALSDEELIAALEKRGKKIATETLTPEQQRKQADLEDAEKRQFAIANLNVTAEQYDEIKNVLNADGAELTKREFEKSYRTENKGASKEEIESAYKDYYNLAQTVKVKEKQKKHNDETLEDEEIEVEVEKPKFDEKLSKWGEARIKTKAERIKEGARQAQKYIDDNFSTHKALIAKANEYAKVAEKVMSDIDFNALPITYKFGNEKKSKEIKAIVKLDDAGKADVQNYINTDLAQLIINTPKYNDKEEIAKQINKYIKERYDNQVGESIYNSGYTSGINDGKIGGSAPNNPITSTSDEVIGELEKSVQQNLPKSNPFI